MYGTVFGTLSFCLYLTFSPSLKGIVFRKDSNNKICFVPFNIVRFMKQPFVSKDVWAFNLLDLNYLFHILFGYMMLLLYNKLIYKESSSN